MKKGTLIAVGIFAILLVLVLATRQREVRVGVKKLELVSPSKEKVVEIEVSGPKAALLKKENGSWFVSDPKKPGQKFPADEQQVMSALDAIQAFRAPDFLTEKAEKLAEFELDDAKGLRVKVTADQAPPFEVILGKAAKSGGAYVREAGSNAVFTTQGNLGWAVRKDANNWRSRKLVSVKLEEIAQLTVKRQSGETLALEAGKDGKPWALKEGTPTPAGYRFDSEAAANIGRALTNLMAQEFLDSETTTDEALGFAGPHDVVEATLGDGKNIGIHFGKRGDAADSAGAGQLKGQLDSVDTDKDKKLSLEELKAAAADASKPEDFRKAAKRLVEDPAVFARFDVGAWALSPPDNAVSGEDLDAVMRTAMLIPTRLDQDKQVYLVAEYAANQFMKTVPELRNTSLFDFDPAKAQKLVIRTADKRVEIVKTDGTWTVKEPKILPSGFEYDASQVESHLSIFKGWKAVSVVEKAPPDKVTGLGKPVAVLEVTLEGGKVQTLRLGNTYTTAKGSKEIYALGAVDKFTYSVGEFYRSQLEQGVVLFKKPTPPPNFGNMGGGGIRGLEQLPPDVRRQLEAQLRQQGHP